MQDNDLCEIELLEIELFAHLTVRKNDWCLIDLLVMHSNTRINLEVPVV